MIRYLLIAILAVSVFSSDALAYYSTRTGTFVQRDPVGYVDGMSLYRYGASNPTKYVDPMGTKIIIYTPNGAPQDKVERYRLTLEEMLQKLCPGASLDRSNPRNPGFPGNRVQCGDSEGDKECNNPPGCRILRRLIDSPTTYPIYIDPDATPGVTFPADRNRSRPRLNWPPIPLTPDGLEREFEPWETLWHELLHLYHYDWRIWPYGLPYNNPGGEKTFPLEELLTIEEMNGLREWYNKCGGGENPVPPRDPFTHPHLKPFGPGDFNPRPPLPDGY